MRLIVPREPDLGAFYADQTEVTQRNFDAFCKASGYVASAYRAAPPKPWTGPGTFAILSATPPTYRWVYSREAYDRWVRSAYSGLEIGRLPARQVTFDDGLAYASWVDCDLPTVKEFRYLLCGGLIHATRYPWGNSPTPPKVVGNYCDASFLRRFPLERSRRPLVDYDDGFPLAAPVGSFAADSWGLYDVSGNVQEWCWPTGAHVQPKGGVKSHSTEGAGMGGSFLGFPAITLECGYVATASRSGAADEGGGFRCIRRVAGIEKADLGICGDP
jgi:formylglycine-generating enzyme required for sulfatase activity